MPTAPRRPCAHQGCPVLVTRGRCPDHERTYDRRRGSRQSRGYGVRHSRWRLMVLARQPLCVDPEQRHPQQLRPAVHADHIVPLPQPNWWDGDWSLENGQGLCVSCHSAKTLREMRAARQ